ncbi:MAG TPA: HPr kinase/phosphorylase [Bacteroidetes bacterium]|nr:HPr kinase/phosphorylase [Bacteroidota bacterium]HRK04472.1 HPr(Ser) kinase/phosphatase [Chlorobiota bacterium]
MPILRKATPHHKESVTVRELLDCPVKFRVLTGDVGLDNLITDKSLHRPQLALAGYTEFFTHYRVQLFGNTEFYYLKSLDPERRLRAFAYICEFTIPCIVCANDHALDDDLVEQAKAHGIAVLVTEYDTTKAIYLLSEFLDDQFAVQTSVHGSFVDVYGVGMLFTGGSGIGKSEIALDLVERGHRLVADDIVMLTKKRESILMGTGTSLVRHFMEIRGLGVIDVRQMFGIRSIRFQKRLEIIVELEIYDPTKEYNRTGLDEYMQELLGVEIQTVRLPIIPGKNITVISETIALNYLLKTYGYNASKVFADRLQDEIERRAQQKGATDNRHVQYFQSDDE